MRLLSRAFFASVKGFVATREARPHPANASRTNLADAFGSAIEVAAFQTSESRGAEGQPYMQMLSTAERENVAACSTEVRRCSARRIPLVPHSPPANPNQRASERRRRRGA